MQHMTDLQDVVSKVLQALASRDFMLAEELIASLPQHGSYKDARLSLKGRLISAQLGTTAGIAFLERRLPPGVAFPNSRLFLAEMLHERGMPLKAAFHLENALRSRLGDDVDSAVCYNLGRCFEDASDFKQAVRWYGKVGRQSDYYLQSVHSAVFLLIQSNHSLEALELCIDRFPVLVSDHPEYGAWIGLLLDVIHKANIPVVVRERISRWEGSKSLPAAAACHIDGLLLEQECKPSEAMAAYQRGVELDANAHSTRYNLSLLQLKSGLIVEGFKNYQSRLLLEHFRLNSLSKTVRDLLKNGRQPPLRDSNQQFFWYEQGLGETLLFSRIVSDLCPSEDVRVVIQDRLYSALELASERFASCFRRELFISESQALKSSANFTGLLPELVGRHIEEVSIVVGHSEPGGKTSKAGFVRDRGVLRIGLCSNSYNPELGSGKSIPLSDLAAYAKKSFNGLQLQFVNLDHQLSDAEFASRIDASNRDSPAAQLAKQDEGTQLGLHLTEIVGRLCKVDMVLATSCTVVHLAGFLGIPTSIFLTPVSRQRFWYWGGMKCSGDRCRWYRSVRLA